MKYIVYLSNYFFDVSTQIALLDVLSSLEISPDYIVGESFGELAAAYAEGVLTAEEAILSAYAIGNVLAEAKVTASQNGK